MIYIEKVNRQDAKDARIFMHLSRKSGKTLEQS
jgi:hypothetical protein